MEHSCTKPLINFLFDTFPLQGKPVFLEELRQFVPTKTPEEISHHEVWYKQYLDLQEKKKVAIQMWKARKEVGFVTVSNTDGSLLCPDPVCVTGYQERCYCFNDSRYLPEILVYLSTVQCHYNAVSFLQNSHNRPSWARYGVSFVSSKSAIIPCCNSTALCWTFSCVYIP